MGNDGYNSLIEAFNIKGQNILITGAANGMGRDIAKNLAPLSPNLFLFDREEESLIRVVKELEELGVSASYFVLDLQDEEKVKQALESIIDENGSIDVLINNAGINYVNNFIDLPWEKCQELININLKSVMFMTHSILPYMKSKSSGRIINIVSRIATVPMKNNTVYASIKSGLLAFTRQLAIENGEYNILVNAISPGLIKTRMNQRTRDNEELLKAYMSRQSIKRLGETKDIANAVLFLISGLSNFMTGSELVVDGGYF